MTVFTEEEVKIIYKYTIDKIISYQLPIRNEMDYKERNAFVSLLNFLA